MKVAVIGGTGSFGLALAKRLVAADYDVVVGSRDADRATEAAAGIGAAGATNEDAARQADLVVLATKADATLETARDLRDAIGSTPILSVAAELSFTKEGVFPTSEATSIAVRLQEILDGPVIAGLHSLAAANLGADEAPVEDALVCGDDPDAKAIVLELAERITAGRAVDCGPAGERPRARGPHRSDRQCQQALSRSRRSHLHGAAVMPDAGIASALPGEVRVIPVRGLPELADGDDLGGLLHAALAGLGGFENGDVVVVAQKAVSKVEGRVVALADVEPSTQARELAGDEGDPHHVEWILRESAEVVRSRPPLVIAETRHGFVCASAGVDASNARGEGTLVLLPIDPDASAARLRARIHELSGAHVGVIVSDSFGRAWRQGTTDVALGCAGITPVRDLRGTSDASGHVLLSTQIAVADELAGAAELVMGKAAAIPAAIVRGVDVSGEGTAAELLMPRERDLFR